MAQYCDALAVLPEYASELLMCLVELLKNYNSRSCQLILGAGALRLIGLKSISVRHLGTLCEKHYKFIYNRAIVLRQLYNPSLHFIYFVEKLTDFCAILKNLLDRVLANILVCFQPEVRSLLLL